MNVGNEWDAISEHTRHVSFLPDNILLLQTPSEFRVCVCVCVCIYILRALKKKGGG
jgi:hypothetical protein